MKRVRAKANINIALCKYWGKYDELHVLPFTTSISFTCDAFYTLTSIESDDKLTQDEFILDGKVQSAEETRKVSTFLQRFNKDRNVRIMSENHVPTAAGLASSASGYAALAMAANTFFTTGLSAEELASLTRFGSGSASRSVFGGFAQWQKQSDRITQLSLEDDWLAMIFIIVNKGPKNISSKTAMKQTVLTSPYFEAFVQSSDGDASLMNQAIKNKDFTQLGRIAKHNAFKMHASMMAANPPILYFDASTLEVLQLVERMNQLNMECYPTMDAGPNVKLIVKRSELHSIESWLKDQLPQFTIVGSTMGKGSEILEIEE